MAIINTGSMGKADFELLLDCLDELDHIKLKRRTQQVNWPTHSLRKSISQPYISQSDTVEAWNPNTTVIGNTFEGNVADAPSFNDTFGSEQLQEIFAYFDQEVATGHLLYSDDSPDEHDTDGHDAADDSSVESGVEHLVENGNGNTDRNDVENLIENGGNNVTHSQIANKNPLIDQFLEKVRSKKLSSKPIITATTRKQCPPKQSKPIDTGKRESNDILKIIMQFNGIELNNDTKQTNFEAKLKKEFKYTVDMNDTRQVEMKAANDKCMDRMSTYSGSSTVVLSDSENDGLGDKPFDLIDCGSVKQKVAFFNDHSSSERSSSASPSINSILSDDDDVRGKFRQNREYFERFFRDQQNTTIERAVERTAERTVERTIESTKPKQEQVKSILKKSEPINVPNTQSAPDSIDPYERLQAIQTYVQTKYFVERIQRLALAFSRLDENRMSTMNLIRLQKFLIFIRDCTLRCNQICNDISSRFLSDVEKNVMSSEELLFSALKMAHFHQVQIYSSEISRLCHLK